MNQSWHITKTQMQKTIVQLRHFFNFFILLLLFLFDIASSLLFVLFLVFTVSYYPGSGGRASSMVRRADPCILCIYHSSRLCSLSESFIHFLLRLCHCNRFFSQYYQLLEIIFSWSRCC